MARQPRQIGTYRIDGKTYSKFKDDENYQFINIQYKTGGRSESVTVWGDGADVPEEQVRKEIKEVSEFEPMSKVVDGKSI